MGKLIYADNAATMPLDKLVLDAMMPYLTENYGNPSSIYSLGRQARQAVTKAREQVAKALDCLAEEIYFTSGGTESDNWAILSLTQSYEKKGRHIISSKIEHHAILHTLEFLEKKGYEVTYLDVDEYGVIDLQQLENSIRPDTILITIMMANNEIGTIQPVDQIGKIAREKGVIFHTDAVQAVGHINISLKNQPIDMLSLSAHKFSGPKGVGALYIRKGLRLPNFVYGGAQERGRRPGTENTAGIVGLGAAIEMSVSDLDKNYEKVSKLRDMLIQNVLKIPYTRLNGHPTARLPGNANFSIEFIEGESLLLMLDGKGICASSGSACTSGELDPSHVLMAIGLTHEVAHGSLRLSLGHQNTKEDVDAILAVLPDIVQKLRDMSPLYEEVKGKERL